MKRAVDPEALKESLLEESLFTNAVVNGQDESDEGLSCDRDEEEALLLDTSPDNKAGNGSERFGKAHIKILFNKAT